MSIRREARAQSPSELASSANFAYASRNAGIALGSSTSATDNAGN